MDAQDFKSAFQSEMPQYAYTNYKTSDVINKLKPVVNAKPDVVANDKLMRTAITKLDNFIKQAGQLDNDVTSSTGFASL